MKKLVAVLAVCLGATVALAGMSPAAQAKLIPGDVNSTGTVDYYDVLMILDWQQGLVELNQAQLLAADVNRDGSVNDDDAAILIGRMITQGKMLVRIEFNVDPETGVVSSKLVDPLATLRARDDVAKADETNPIELHQLGAACPDCTGCSGDTTKTVEAYLQWQDEGRDVNANLFTFRCANSASVPSSGNVVFDGNQNPPGWSCAYVSPVGDGDSFLEVGENITITSEVPLSPCSRFLYYIDITFDVGQG